MAPFFVIFTPTVSNPKFCNVFKQKESKWWLQLEYPIKESMCLQKKMKAVIREDDILPLNMNNIK